MIDQQFAEAEREIMQKNQQEIEELTAVYGIPTKTSLLPQIQTQNFPPQQRIQPSRRVYYKKNFLEELLGRKI